MWYKDWFADEHYLALYQHRNAEDASKLLDLIERTVHPHKDARILDLACGAGRHSIAFAKRGYTHVTGVDLSPTLIRKARESAEEAHVHVTFVNRDMREFTGTYDLIVNLFTSFGYFEHDSENEEVIAHVAGGLEVGGCFVIDYFNASVVRATLVPHSQSTLECGEPVDQYRQIDGERVNKKIVIKTDAGVKEFRESVRLFTRAEIEGMMIRQGLRIAEVFGNYTGAAFDEGSSPRVIIVARKDA